MDDVRCVFGGEYEGSSEEEIYAAAFDILITQLTPLWRLRGGFVKSSSASIKTGRH